MMTIKSILRRMPGIFFWLTLILIAMAACDTEDAEDRAKKDRKKIIDYLHENTLDYYEHESGVFIVIDNPGSGSHPDEGSRVNMSYTGYLLDGEIFDRATNTDIVLSNTVRGFRKGVMEFKYGGSGTILIPSGLGYGSSSIGSIPRNAVLIYDVEIIDF